MQTQPRIASSEVMDALFGDTVRFRRILAAYVPPLIALYGGNTTLPDHFRAIPDRIICICPMVLFQAFLSDTKTETPHDLLGPLGLAMYSISTHDDVVDEHPENRDEIAGLIYAGNIASLHGISLLVANGYPAVAQAVIHLMNLNHCFQTDIVSSLWKGPSDEDGYIKAISHTGYWAAIGTIAASEYLRSKDERINHGIFAMKFGELYGRMCQIYDDVREIEDDVRNGYFSLPISTALHSGYDLDTKDGRAASTNRSKEIAEQTFMDIRALCEESWPALMRLAERMHAIGSQLAPK